jgi:uncharacterized HAD superfamily protein
MIIVDLDNCIADDGWRIPKILWSKKNPNERYQDYHQLSAFDEVRNEKIAYADEPKIILTARPVSFHAITEEWLRRKEIQYKHLLMRNVNDFRLSWKVKETHVDWLPRYYDVPLSSIRMAYDDHPEIGNMYRRMGIPFTQMKIHNLDAYKSPSHGELK